MPLMPAICTQCKGALTVDPKEKSGVCPYCGTTFLNQDVINNYNITNVQNNVTNIGNLHADVVNVQDSKSADNLYKKAVTYLNFKDFNAAFTAFDEMTKTYPYDHRGWKGMMLAGTNNLDKNYFKSPVQVNKLKEYYNYYNKAKEFSGEVNENDPADKYLPYAEKCLDDWRRAQRGGLEVFYNTKISILQSNFDKNHTPEIMAERKLKAEKELVELKKKKKKKGFNLLIRISIILTIVLSIGVPLFFVIAFFANGGTQYLGQYDPGAYSFNLTGEPLFGITFDYFEHSFVFGLIMLAIIVFIIMSIITLAFVLLRAIVEAMQKKSGSLSELDYDINQCEKILDGSAYRLEKESLDREINKLKSELLAEIRRIE